MGKIAGGVTLLGVAGPFSNIALAEDAAEEEQPDFKWEERDFPCDLISEITDGGTEKGYRAFKYDPDYRAHISEITFEMNEETKKSTKHHFYRRLRRQHPRGCQNGGRKRCGLYYLPA